MKIILAFLFSLSALCAADVSLEWDPNNPAGAVTKFTVYEKVGDTWVKKGDATGNKFTVTGVTPGIHTYAVTAIGPWGESAKSNEQSTPDATKPPTNLRITTIVDVIVQPAPAPAPPP